MVEPKPRAQTTWDDRPHAALREHPLVARRRRVPGLPTLVPGRLSPIYPSPLADFGYDLTDHTAVDPTFGTLADLDRLVAEAHARGLRLLMDFVPCHTSIEHPWFGEHPDRYIWADGGARGGPPNNWRSAFGGPAWTFDERRGRWYLLLVLPGAAGPRLAQPGRRRGDAGGHRLLGRPRRRRLPLGRDRAACQGRASNGRITLTSLGSPRRRPTSRYSTRRRRARLKSNWASCAGKPVSAMGLPYRSGIAAECRRRPARRVPAWRAQRSAAEARSRRPGPRRARRTGRTPRSRSCRPACC